MAPECSSTFSCFKILCWECVKTDPWPLVCGAMDRGFKLSLSFLISDVSDLSWNTDTWETDCGEAALVVLWLLSVKSDVI